MKASFFFSFVAEKREMAMERGRERERERLVEFRRLKKKSAKDDGTGHVGSFSPFLIA
jgi:hypothetical protein